MSACLATVGRFIVCVSRFNSSLSTFPTTSWSSSSISCWATRACEQFRSAASKEALTSTFGALAWWDQQSCWMTPFRRETWRWMTGISFGDRRGEISEPHVRRLARPDWFGRQSKKKSRRRHFLIVLNKFHVYEVKSPSQFVSSESNRQATKPISSLESHPFPTTTPPPLFLFVDVSCHTTSPQTIPPAPMVT